MRIIPYTVLVLAVLFSVCACSFVGSLTSDTPVWMRVYPANGQLVSDMVKTIEDNMVFFEKDGHLFAVVFYKGTRDDMHMSITLVK